MPRCREGLEGVLCCPGGGHSCKEGSKGTCGVTQDVQVWNTANVFYWTMDF